VQEPDYLHQDQAFATFVIKLDAARPTHGT
jgi:hypothetical protein